MTARVEIVIGSAPTGALALADHESLEELADAVAAALAGGDAALSLVQPPRSGSASATPTLPDAFAAVLRAAAGAGHGQLRCWVASQAVRDRLLAIQRSAEDRTRRYTHDAWTIVLRTGDIAAVVADAVVNAANTRLKLGGGVSGALARAAGPGLQAEMTALGRLAPGRLVVTGAHRMRTTTRILHVPTADGDEATVRRAVDDVLAYCRDHRLASVALPALGTGTGGLDVAIAAQLYIDALRAAAPPPQPCTVILVLWDEAAFLAYERRLDAAGFTCS